MTPTLILTRPMAQSEAFAAQLRAAHPGPLRIILSPVMQIVPVEVARPDALRGVILTSANGADAAARLMPESGLPAYCVGARTGAAAAAAGFVPHVSPGQTASDLVRHLTTLVKPAGMLAHIRGAHTVGQVADTLRAEGFACADLVAYDQVAVPLSEQARDALAGESPVILPLFSPRTAKLISRYGPFAAPIHAVAISAAVAPDFALEALIVAERAEGNAMVAATLRCVAALQVDAR